MYFVRKEYKLHFAYTIGNAAVFNAFTISKQGK